MTTSKNDKNTRTTGRPTLNEVARLAGVSPITASRALRGISSVATELADADKVPVLRAYLLRWKAEVGAFFDGIDGTSTDDEITAIAHRHPVFSLSTPEAV